MVILIILGWVLGGTLAFLLLLRLFAPGLLALPYSWFISLFIKNPPFVDPDKFFPESKILRENWHSIRAELDQLLQQKEDIPTFEKIDPIQRYLSAKDQIPWRTFFLKVFNNWVPGNCEKVPFTSGLLKQMPNITTAMFSILEGGKHLPGHFGFFRGIYRYHLGLIVPQNQPVYLRVKGQKYFWKEGEDMMFDDTYWHEAWNKSDQLRVVLFIDIMRQSDLPGFLRPINAWMCRFFTNIDRVKQAAKRAEVA